MVEQQGYDIAYTFCTIVENAGYYVMIYANLDYFNNKLNDKRLDRYDKWLAEWKNKPTYNKAFGIWQYSSKVKSNITASYKLFIAVFNSDKVVSVAKSLLSNPPK